MSITIRDVAEAAGVSLMAVSKVLHGRGSSVRVSQKTAEHIRATAELLGYRPNALARSLRLGKTSTIGVLFQGFEHLKQGYYVELLNGLLTRAFEHGYSLTLCPKLTNPNGPDALSDGRFDGIVWSKLQDDPQMIEAIETTRLPVVVLHVPIERRLQNVPTLCCDNGQGLDLAVDHLKALGHRRIAFLYEDIQANFVETRARIDAFIIAMSNHGLLTSYKDVFELPADGGGFAEWRSAHPTYTSVIARGEWFAAQILRRAAAAGIAVPGNLSLVCFDSTSLSESCSPRLTAIRQPVEEMAAKAMELLLEQLGPRPPQPGHHRFGCSLDVRESTGPVG